MEYKDKNGKEIKVGSSVYVEHEGEIRAMLVEKLEYFEEIDYARVIGKLYCSDLSSEQALAYKCENVEVFNPWEVIKREEKSSALIEQFKNGTGRVSFFNKDNHWSGDIMLSKEQINDYFSEI